MTGPRQERKSLGALPAFAAMALTGLALFAPLPTDAATTEWVVLDRNTGLAIGGVDPVAYFTGEGAKVGRPDLEFHYARAVWRFSNEGNRAAFVANPEIYMPRFGGHDPVAIGRGVGTAGNAAVWKIENQRLYLFYDAESRKAFNDDAERAIDTAERRWPDVLLTLSP
jgi:hypothetical protein